MHEIQPRVTDWLFISSYSKFIFPKEDSPVCPTESQKDLPSDGKYEGFAYVNDAIISELKNLFSLACPQGTNYGIFL